MRQFLLGATCGALSVGLLAFAFRQPPTTEAAGQPSAVVPENAAVSTAPDRIGAPIHAGIPRNQEQAQPTNQPAPLNHPIDRPQVALNSAMPKVNSGAIADPIPSIGLSSEHAKMLSPAPVEGRPPTLQELHMQFATERDDQNWSLVMEQNLSLFLAQSNSSGEFEILTVDCRSTLCEILAFGNLPNSPQRWNALGSEMGKQPWWSNFKGNSTSTSERNGRTTIVTILQRANK
jgi:hypothetical protein